MKRIKIGSLVFYIILSYLAISFPLTVISQFAIGVLVLLAAVHAMECYMYRKLALQAPGGLGWNLLNLFLFGVLHMMDMKDEIRARGEVPA
jgi:uncharacterized protein YhhL (DUF1145 family)